MRKNRWIIAIVALLLCGACLAGAVAMKKGVSIFKGDDDQLIRNPANIITPEMYELKEGPSNCGFKYEINEDGVVSIKGSGVYTDGYTRVASLTLPAGTYTFTANDYSDLANFSMKVRTDDSNSDLLVPKSGSNTFTLEEETKVVIVFYYHAGFVLNEDNCNFYPILVPGDTAQDFYIPAGSDTVTDTAEK